MRFSFKASRWKIEIRALSTGLYCPLSGQGQGGSGTLNSGQDVNVGKLVDPSIFDPANATFYSYEVNTNCVCY